MKKILLLFLVLVASCTRDKTDEGMKRMFESLPAVLSEEVDFKELAAQYELAREEWDAAVSFLSREDLDTLPTGRYELTEGGTYANIQEYEIDPEKQGRFEAHRKYIDIQYLQKGEEKVYISKLADCRERAKEYTEEKDAELYYLSVNAKEVQISPERFVILFPDDAHMPGRPTTDYSGPIRKIVVKVRYAKDEG